MSNYLSYLLIALIVGFFIRRWILFRSVRTKLPEYLREGAIVIDVRSTAEFVSGHFEGSINIPLNELRGKVGGLNAEKTVLLCCASGSRSGMAAAILKAKGFKKVINVGPWSNLLSVGRE